MLARHYNTEMLKALNTAAAEIRSAERLAELTQANLTVEIDNDLPAYLVFMILANTRKLRDVAPDHILVKAVQAALDREPGVNPDQSTFDL